MDIFHQILQKYWGYSDFRPLQENIIHSIYSGKDTLGLMPTGGGKSITFQVPALAMEGVCLVITPLIALMKDQVQNLKNRGIKALAIYTGLSQKEILVTLDNVIMGDYKFLYISPERLSSQLFQTKLKNINISLLVIDEAHCISQWGYDFRPSYMNIASVRQDFPSIPVLALTATATPDVVNDIQNILGFKSKNIFRKSFERSNLAYIVKYTETKPISLIQILNKVPGTSIVYVRSRKKTKEIADELNRNNLLADYYHAGLSNEEKDLKQEKWKSGNCRIIVSTNAFGMGIDKPNVRSVIHLDLPSSLEEYYQEAGRAGRDEKPAYAIVLYDKTDITKLKKRISDSFPDREFIKKVYEYLSYFFQIAEGFGADISHDFDLHHFCHTYKLPLLQTNSALGILNLSNYIEYSEENENKSRIKFLVYRNDLYRNNFSSDFEILISTILRLYTGVFADYTAISEKNISIHINKTPHEVYEMLKYMSKRHIIDYLPYKRKPIIVLTRPRVATKHLSITKDVLETRKERFENRINGMIYYIEKENICRSRILLSYFGENNVNDCGKCDVCISKRKKGLNSVIFNEIALLIENSLKEDIISLTNIVELLSNKYEKEDIIQVIRFKVDNQSIHITADNFLKLNN